jgi:hypothetical protein
MGPIFAGLFLAAIGIGLWGHRTRSKLVDARDDGGQLTR